LTKYELFFPEVLKAKRNAYFKFSIDICYVTLANQSYKEVLGPGTLYIAPSGELGDNHSWDFGHLGHATRLLSRPNDFPNFPAVRFMAVDETFLRNIGEIWKWVDFFREIPSLEWFTFIVDGNSILLRKERQTRNWKAKTIWSIEIRHPSVSISESLNE
jgi:hypothetical protein